MRKQRYILSFLAVMALLYYAIPNLQFGLQTSHQLFTTAWVILAFLAISGNLIGILYSHPKSMIKSQRQKIIQGQKVQKRQYVRKV